MHTHAHRHPSKQENSPQKLTTQLWITRDEQGAAFSWEGGHTGLSTANVPIQSSRRTAQGGMLVEVLALLLNHWTDSQAQKSNGN